MPSSDPAPDFDQSQPSDSRSLVAVARWAELQLNRPVHALVGNVDLVVTRLPGESGHGVSVLYGRCLHRGALMADGSVQGHNLVCGLHGWDYRIDTGVSEYDNSERLQKFWAEVQEVAGVQQVVVDAAEIAAWEEKNPQPYRRGEYLGDFADIHGAEEEPHVKLIQELAKNGLKKTGHHGPAGAMGVPRRELPTWDDLQFLTAQVATKPLLDEETVNTSVVIGPRAKKPLQLDTPLFVSDMSFGALSREAKVALARGAEMAGTAICSGEGGMLQEEQQANSRYLYELASARFGFSLDKVALVQAFHFKGGQGAKTGTGGHLPGEKVDEAIASVRGIPAGTPAISPATFPDLHTAADYRALGNQVRDAAGGIPIGFKLSAQHIEADLGFAVEAGADYIILDGRGGGTGAAPLLFRDHISVPTIPALARARRWIDSHAPGTTLVVTGGLRTPADFAKALALGADAIAVSNAALQAIGCLGMRACNSNNCPVGIATQKDHLRARLIIDESAARLDRFFRAATELMCVLARACGHDRLSAFSADDLTSWKRETAALAGVSFAGAVSD